MINLSVFAWVTESWKEISILFLTLFLAIFACFKYRFSYWKRHGFPYIEGNIPWGNINDFVLTKLSISETVTKLYKEAQGHKYVGYYSLWTPTLLVRDPEIIKRVLVKDFNFFCDRGMYYNDKDDPLSSHLFALDGIKWKTTRSKLNPMFASPKVKTLFVTMKKCALQLQEYLKETVDSGKSVVDFKELTSRHSINVIANTAIGMENHTIKHKSELFKIANLVTEPSAVQGFRFGIAMLAKDFAKLINMRFTPKSVERFYLDLTKKIVEYRSKSNVVRNDVMSSLMELWDSSTSYEKQLKPDDETSLSLRDMAAQTFIFVLAANETATSTICFVLYELAFNPKIQEKLIAEVDAAGSPEEITYEQLTQMKYLMMVLNECWRKHPPGGILIRECQEDYVLPEGEVLKKGITLTVPVDAIQHDPTFFPEPEKFDPERFNKESPSHIVQPYTFIPFGEGRRNCIGKRYGEVQAMITLFALVSMFRFEITTETQVPPKIEPKVFVTQPQGGMHLKVIRRK